MSEMTPKASHHSFDMETLVGYILVVGVGLSMALVALGLAWHWARDGNLVMDYEIKGLNFLEFVVADVRNLFAPGLRPRYFVSMGIAVLMATPYIRVLASMLYFAIAERNWKYTLFTAWVLGLLTYSLFLR